MAALGHIGMYCSDLEAVRRFYEKYFGARSGKKYVNPAKCFQSYLLSFGDGGCRLELMQRCGVEATRAKDSIGLAHVSFSVGSAAEVDSLTEALRSDGCRVLGEPRTTGDGFYESVVADPEGNEVEITI